MTVERPEVESTEKKGNAAHPKTVSYHYIKSSVFRSVPADGCLGGLRPRGGFQMSFFSERQPIPQIVEHEVEDLGGMRLRVGKEVSRAGRDGIIRDMEVTVVMTLDVARVVHKWMGEQLDAIDGAAGSEKEQVDGSSDE